MKKPKELKQTLKELHCTPLYVTGFGMVTAPILGIICFMAGHEEKVWYFRIIVYLGGCYCFNEASDFIKAFREQWKIYKELK